VTVFRRDRLAGALGLEAAGAIVSERGAIFRALLFGHFALIAESLGRKIGEAQRLRVAARNVVERRQRV